jgi:hypothetical protein
MRGGWLLGLGLACLFLATVLLVFVARALY